MPAASQSESKEVDAVMEKGGRGHTEREGGRERNGEREGGIERERENLTEGRGSEGRARPGGKSPGMCPPATLTFVRVRGAGVLSVGVLQRVGGAGRVVAGRIRKREAGRGRERNREREKDIERKRERARRRHRDEGGCM